MRAAPLPGARVAVVVFLKVAHGPLAFWIGVPPPLRRRPPPSRHVPWLSGCGWRRAEEWPRPRPVPPPERLRRGWVTEPARPRSRRSHQLGRVTRPGAGCGPPGGPNHPIMGPGRSGDPSAAGSVLPETHGARHPIPTLNWREQQPSQFKRLEDLHEDGRVPNVHIVSCRFRLPMPCLQKENGFVDAGLDSGR